MLVEQKYCGFDWDRTGEIMNFAQLRVAVPILAMAGLLSACLHSPDSSPIYMQQMTGAGGVERAALLPGGNYSFATTRLREDGTTRPHILCVAPSPDWASAITTAQSLQGNVSTPVGTTVSGTLSNSVAETITAMVGRTAGVVALRDGLYNACQAYANGVIGKDAYALILSQYGNLLVALAGPGAGSAPAAGATSVVTAQQMQLQMMQAMLVACISNQDPTVRSGDQNPLLAASCANLVNSINQAAPKLLMPIAVSVSGAAQGGSKPGGDGKTAKEGGNPIVLQLQTFLKTKDCDGCQALDADGVDGPRTQAALAAYQKKYGSLFPSKNN